MKKIVAALIALLLPVSAAAEGFSCMDVIARITKKTGLVPEQLTAYIQPLDVVATEGAIRVQLSDALFVDNAASAAWTIENISDEPLYIVYSFELGGVLMTLFSYRPTYGMLQPGEIRYCGFAGYLKDRQRAAMAEDTQPLSLHVMGMRLQGEPYDRDDAIDGMAQAFDYRAFDKEVSRLFSQEGKLVMSIDGYIEHGEVEDSFHFDAQSKVPYAAQRYIHSGKLTANSFASIETPLKKHVAARSILPEEPVEAAVGGGLISVTRADLSPAGLIVEASLTFPDEATALSFYDGDIGRPSPIQVADSDGVASYYGIRSSGFSGSSGYMSMMNDVPTRQADGSYVWQYRFEHWYIVSDKDTYYLLLNTREFPKDGVYKGDLSNAANTIRLGGDTH